MVRVLLVDDSGTMRAIIKRSLLLFGVDQISEAGDGRSAFAMFQSVPFDFVITDWNMPNMNGIELVRAIRQSGSAVPIMMITTEAERPRVVEAIQAGVSDYLVKPFSSQDLRSKVEKWITGLAAISAG